MADKPMNRSLAKIVLCFCFIVFTQKAFAVLGTDWYAATLNAAFSGRYMFGGLSFDDGAGEKLWVIGGAPPAYPHFNDVWNSTDGADWHLVTGNAAFTPRASFGSVVYGGKMWVIAGDSGGTTMKDVWSSGDGITWVINTGAAAFSPRCHIGAAVFNDGSGDRIWIAAGALSSGSGCMNDVWNSSDGSTWTQATTAGLFSARRNAGMLSYAGELWIIGGYDSAGNFLNDVWSSTDGINWACITPSAAFQPRCYHSVCVFDGKMWVIGGAGASTYSDAWWSVDGVNWTCASSATGMNGPVSGSAVSYGGCLWEISGSYTRNVFYSCPAFTSTPSQTTTFTATPTASPGFTASFTVTPTFTNTFTSTLTRTWTPLTSPTGTPAPDFTPTITETPTPFPAGEIVIYPNPFNPHTAVNGTLKFLYVAPGSKVSLYTLSGELTATKDTATNCIEWDGKNGWGSAVSPGVYYYILEDRNSGITGRGKIFIINK